jgi:hypothetical protein
MNQCCVEEMNNKHCVLWGSTKENNKLASIMLPRKDGLLQTSVQIEAFAGSLPLRKQVTFFSCPTLVRSQFWPPEKLVLI